MAYSLSQISVVWLCLVGLGSGHPYPHAYPVNQLEEARQYSPLRQFQLPASTSRLVPNNLNDGLRYGLNPALYSLGQQQVQQQQQQEQAALAQQYYGQQDAVQALSPEQGAYLQSFIANFAGPYPGFGQGAAPQQLQRFPQQVAEAEKPQAGGQQAVGGLAAQQQLYYDEQAAAQAQLQALHEEAEQQKLLLQYYQQQQLQQLQRPSANYVFYSLPGQSQAAPLQAALSDKRHGLRPASLGLQRFQIRSGQEQNNASSEVTETQEGGQSPQGQEETGPSIAQAKPQAISVAGPGGVAAAAPVGTAVVGPGGMALSAPSATALAGTKPKPGQAGSASKLRQAIRYLY